MKKTNLLNLLALSLLTLVVLSTTALAHNFKPGDELYTKRKIGTINFYHAGVYIGNNQVVHVSGTPVTAARNLFRGKKLIHVIKSSLGQFSEGKATKKGPTKLRFSRDKIVKRALSRVGRAYNWEPVTNNCQHFSSWVVSGRRHSPFSGDIKRAHDRALKKFGPKVTKAVKKAAKAYAKAVVKAAKKIEKIKKKIKDAFTSKKKKKAQKKAKQKAKKKAQKKAKQKAKKKAQQKAKQKAKQK